jgi:hypothetical protein
VPLLGLWIDPVPWLPPASSAGSLSDSADACHPLPAIRSRRATLMQGPVDQRSGVAYMGASSLIEGDSPCRSRPMLIADTPSRPSRTK